MERRRQLREYRARPGQLDAFVRAWAAHVRPLRERFGFVVEGAWVDRQAERFVWIVSHDSPDTFAAAEQAYYASPQRAALDPDPVSFLATVSTSFVDRVD